MSKARKQQKIKTAPKIPAQVSENNSKSARPSRATLLLPIPLIFFLLVWAWAGWWYADVFRTAREYSFWSADETLMQFMNGRPWEMLWIVGRMLLTTYKWPILGGFIMAFMLSACTWALGYNLRLGGKIRCLQYIPAGIYMGIIAWQGFDVYYESETGMVMGIPFVATLALLVVSLIIKSFSRKPVPRFFRRPQDETPLQNRLSLLFAILAVASAVVITLQFRPYVRITTTMQCQMMRQDWNAMQQTAKSKSDLSYRTIAAYYAISLVQTDRICENLFDIRMDYDEPYMHAWGGNESNGLTYYVQDADYYAGLVQTAIHHGMENMTMCGPTLRTLKLLTKCALLRSEWKVASKYLHILEKVPFEGDFIDKYKPMLYNKEAVNTNREFAMIRLLEPARDAFENNFVQPVFLGYNAALVEGHSMNALKNSLAVNIYTKTMPQFLMRCQPLVGSTPPANVSDALTLMSGKNPDILKSFPNLEFNQQKLSSFLAETQQYIQATGTLTSSENRALHARELWDKWKGYYPYYYFFGNLKATKKKDTTSSSNSGVN